MSNPGGAAGNLLSDTAHADDSQRGTKDFLTMQDIRIVMDEARAARVVVAAHNIAGRGHQQRKGHVGCGAVHESRRIANGDTAAPSHRRD